MSSEQSNHNDEPAPWENPRRRIRLPALLVCAVFSGHTDAIEWARSVLETKYGPIDLQSESFTFHHTEYYQKTMGGDLCKQFFVFRNLVGEDCLPDVKRFAITMEKELAGKEQYLQQRPVNIDPGILTLGKFLLATTKDQAHRIYLRDGIYAEVTLRYQEGKFHPWPWTYDDYREPCYHGFLREARDYYRSRLAEQAKAENNG